MNDVLLLELYYISRKAFWNITFMCENKRKNLKMAKGIFPLRTQSKGFFLLSIFVLTT